MTDKLTSIFDGLEHAVSKLGAADDSNNRAMMPFDVDHIRDGLKRFRTALIDRDEPFEEDLEWSYRKLHRAFKVLDAHVHGVEYADADLADVAADFVFHELKHLKKYAAEIDEDYAEGASGDPLNGQGDDEI